MCLAYILFSTDRWSLKFHFVNNLFGVGLTRCVELGCFLWWFEFFPRTKHQSSVLLFATASARHVTLRTDRRIHWPQNENGFVYHLLEIKVGFQGMVLAH